MTAIIHRLPPALLALLLQGLAVALALLVARIIPWPVSVLTFALLSGTLAALFSWRARQARWWLLIQFCFVPASLGLHALNVPPAIFLILFALLLAVYWSACHSQVPLYFSSKPAWRALESALPPASNDVQLKFIDLGCGIGGVLTHLAQARPDGDFHGVESAPLPYLLSRLRLKTKDLRNCKVHWGSLWDCDLSRYDVVYAYLSPAPMPTLWEKARREMRPGTLFISNSFCIPGIPPQETITIEDLHSSTLLIWHM